MPQARRLSTADRLALVFVGLVVLVIVTVFIRSHWFGPWPKLRDEVGRFGVPDGMRRVLKIEEGSEACFISCNEPRIAVVFGGINDSKAACESLQRRLEQKGHEVNPTPEYVSVPEEAGCFFRASLDRLGTEGSTSAAVLRGEELQRYVWLTASQPAAGLEPSELVAVVLFNSGID